jgi:hypothetical protein
MEDAVEPVSLTDGLNDTAGLEPATVFEIVNFGEPIVRPGSKSDLRAIERFRYAVKVLEQGRQNPNADHARQRLPDPLDRGALHFVYRNGGEIIGYLRVNLDLPLLIARRLNLSHWRAGGPRTCYIANLMAAPGALSRVATAAALLKVAYSAVAKTDVVMVVGHTSPSLLPLWRRFGARPFGAPFQLDAVGLQLPIALIMGHYDHLRAVGSPLAEHEEGRITDEEAGRLWRLLPSVVPPEQEALRNVADG